MITAPAAQPFVLFQRSHLVVLALTFVVPLALAGLVRVLKNPALGRIICGIFAAAIVLDWVAWYVYQGRIGGLNLGNALLMDLCSWAAIATIIALTGRRQKVYELAYFWALAGTLQGLLRPGIDYDYPDFMFVEFSIFHGGIIAAVVFMTVGMKMRPYLSSLPRVIAWSLVYMAAAGLTDWLLGVDYGFLRSKPIYPSLFDLMPAWPWYLPVVMVIGVISMLIFYTPFFVIDLVRGKKCDYQPISLPL